MVAPSKEPHPFKELYLEMSEEDAQVVQAREAFAKSHQSRINDSRWRSQQLPPEVLAALANGMHVSDENRSIVTGMSAPLVNQASNFLLRNVNATAAIVEAQESLAAEAASTAAEDTDGMGVSNTARDELKIELCFSENKGGAFPTLFSPTSEALKIFVTSCCTITPEQFVSAVNIQHQNSAEAVYPIDQNQTKTAAPRRTPVEFATHKLPEKAQERM
jgi:hypothetical protein